MAPGNGNCVIETTSLGECWLQASRLILERGLASRYDGLKTKEIANLTMDFWMPQDALDLAVYAHSQDFGKKASGNLVELASLQSKVSQQLACPMGSLTLHVKSAHIYEPEWEAMLSLVG